MKITYIIQLSEKTQQEYNIISGKKSLFEDYQIMQPEIVKWVGRK